MQEKKIVRYGELGREGTRSFLVKEWNGQSREFFLRTDQTNTCLRAEGGLNDI